MADKEAGDFDKEDPEGQHQNTIGVKEEGRVKVK